MQRGEYMKIKELVITKVVEKKAVDPSIPYVVLE